MKTGSRDLSLAAPYHSFFSIYGGDGGGGGFGGGEP